MRRRSRALVVGAAMVAGMAVSVPAASAALSETPDPTWMTNGTVYAVIRSGDYIYIGGQFTRVRSVPPGTKGTGYAAFGVARINAATGVGDKTWTPDVTRTDGKRAIVYALAAAGGKIWIGGTFDRVDGQPRLNFAAASESTGALDPNVTARVGPELGKNVLAMVASSSTVFIGGRFNDVDGTPRKRLAAFDVGTGNLRTDWKPQTAGLVRTMAFDCTGATVLAGGNFDKAKGSSGTAQPRPRVARFDAATGALHAWAIPVGALTNGLVTYDLGLHCGTKKLFVGFGGQNYLYAIDFGDDVGDVLWARQSAGNVQTVAVRGDRVLFGGHFSQVTYPTGTCSETKPKLTRFAVIDLNGNCDLGWRPSFDGKFYGPWDILVTDAGSRIWVGGQFTEVSKTPQYFLARFTDD